MSDPNDAAPVDPEAAAAGRAPKPIQTEPELFAAVERLARAKELALDTEFHGEGRYWSRLMLIQLATRDELVLIDPLAIPAPKLAEAFERLFERAVVIGHALDRDLELLYRMTGHLPSRVLDTQIAAGLLGHGDQIGLQPLVHEVLGVELDKAWVLADWGRRPLLAEQLEYAADDVRYLIPLAEKLGQQLARAGRLAWAIEECGHLVDADHFAPPEPLERWRAVRRRTKLDGRGLAVLREVAAERERLAREADLPPPVLMPDDVLADLARRAPTARNELVGASNRKRPPALAQHAERWLAAVKRGLAAAEVTAPADPPRGDGSALQLLRFAVAELARSSNVAPALLLSIVEPHLAALLVEPSIDAEALADRVGLVGWRRQLFAGGLADVLGGRVAYRLITGPEPKVARATTPA
jgi:ribonuclease D